MADQELENKPTTTEPTTTEPVETADNAAFVSVGPTIFTALSFTILILFVVGTPITWFSRTMGTSTTEMSLWMNTTSSSLPLVVTTRDFFIDSPCGEFKDRLKAIQSFSIISIFLAAAMVIVGLLVKFAGKSIRIAIIFALAAFATSLIAWAMGIRLYYQSGMCGMDSLSQSKYVINAGIVLIITGWVLSAIAIIVAIKDAKIPALFPDAVIDKITASIFTVFQFVVLVFTVVGTPTQWFYVWDTEDVLSRITLWTYRQYTSGTITTDMSLRDVQCGDFARYAKFAEAFSIMAIGFAFFSVIAGALAQSGTVGRKVTIITGLLSFLTALITVGAGLTLYYKQFCAMPSLDQSHYIMTGGFAIFVAAFVIALINSLMMISVALSQVFNANAHGGNTRYTAILMVLGAAVSLLFEVIAANLPQIGNTVDDKNWVHLTYWKIETKSGGLVTAGDYGCDAVSQRMVGAGALNIIAIFFVFMALVMAVLQLSSAALRKAASAFGLIGSLAQLVSWGLVASVYTTSLCGAPSYSSLRYQIEVGGGLVVAAWCITLLTSILNLVVAPAPESA